MSPSPVPPSASSIFPQIQGILRLGTFNMPVDQYPGTGGPGRLLESLLNIRENNADLPDLGGWEIKFHGGNALLTLLHKDPEPRGVIKDIVEHYGQIDSRQRISFRHTICGTSNRGFIVENINSMVIIKKINEEDGPTAYWHHNTLMNVFSSKLRRLIVVSGTVLKSPRRVRFDTAFAYWEPDISNLISCILDGTFCIDFDARTNGARGTSIRNHGTKFRIRVEDIARFYDNSRQIVS